MKIKNAIYNYCKEQKWVTKQGDCVKYKDLTTSHLKNILKFVARNIGPLSYSFETLLMLYIELERRELLNNTEITNNSETFEELFDFVKEQEWVTIKGNKLKCKDLEDKYIDDILMNANIDKGFISISSLLLVQLEKARRIKLAENKRRHRRKEYGIAKQGEVYTNIENAFQVLVTEDSHTFNPCFPATVIVACNKDHAYQKGYHKSEWSKRDFILSTK